MTATATKTQASPVIPVVVRPYTDGSSDMFCGGVLVAAVRPPRPWDLPDQWRALDVEGRAIEVNDAGAAYDRAFGWAERIAAKMAGGAA